VTTLPGATYTTKNAVGATITGDIPGYTKTNKYRVYGNITKFHYDFGFGALTAGAWLEFNDTSRQQTDVDLTTGGFNYIEKPVTAPPTGLRPGEVTPLYVKFDQNSHGNHTEEFVELELRPFHGLKITPGFKHVDFNRRIDALYNQTTRYAQRLSKTYTADLPFLTVNYQPFDNLSIYGQYAKGFLAPPLSQLYVARPELSSVDPQKSTNYQFGVVYHGTHLSIDADVYAIDFTNKFASSTSPVDGVIFTNIGGALYKGIEGQVTYAFNNGFALFANASRNYAKAKSLTAAGIRAQVAKAPLSTAAAGILYKHGPIRFSLTDKWTGPQFADQSDLIRIDPYNTVNLAASYDIGPARVGINVTDLLDSQKIVQISGSVDPTTHLLTPSAQFYYQPGRAITGQVTFKF
jgi:iron complex outermembrane receptor protein